MATGIVSQALRLAGQPGPAGGLLAAAAAAYAAVLVLVAARTASCPAALRAELGSAQSGFTGYAFAAASALLGAAVDRRLPAVAAALTLLAAAGWAAVTLLVPARLARRGQAVLTSVTGSWYLWAVATQALAIAAAGWARPAGPGALARVAAVTAWVAGVLLYAAISVLVAVRLVRAPPGPAEPTAPYWVAMGAASVSVLAAAGILRAGLPRSGTAAPLLTGTAVALWIVASALIVPLAGRSAWRHLRAGAPLAYRADLWMIVFPAGMYATASMQLGLTARLPAIRAAGTAAVIPAAAAWAVVCAAMIITGARAALRPSHPHGTDYMRKR